MTDCFGKHRSVRAMVLNLRESLSSERPGLCEAGLLQDKGNQDNLMTLSLKMTVCTSSTLSVGPPAIAIVVTRVCMLVEMVASSKLVLANTRVF